MPAAAHTTYSVNGVLPYIDPGDARTRSVKMGVSLTVAKGTWMGQITASGLYIPWLTGAVDGSDIPKGIAQYSFTTDASGNVTIQGDPSGITYPTAPIWWRGAFLIGDLVGGGATLITKQPGFRMLAGAVTDAAGIIYLP